MNASFNKIIFDTLIQFIVSNKLTGDKPYLSLSNNQRKYIFGNKNYGKSLSECYKDISNFDIFKPISQFNYYNNFYLIKFDSDYNLKIFKILLDMFLNSEYENLFFSTITKIIPINYCIENQPWSIVKKFLTTKPLKSNGLPEVDDSKKFFNILTSFIHEKEFESSFIQFCEFNKSLIKRIENQECLKYFVCYFKNPKLNLFYIESKEPLTQIKNNFSTIYINKKALFSRFSDVVTRKKEPVDKLINIFSVLGQTKISKSFIQSVFIEQTDERFPELLVFISFKEDVNYSLEDYYLYLLDYFLNNNVSVNDNIEKISSYFFLNLKLPVKSTKVKEKTAKI